MHLYYGSSIISQVTPLPHYPLFCSKSIIICSVASGRSLSAPREFLLPASFELDLDHSWNLWCTMRLSTFYFWTVSILTQRDRIAWADSIQSKYFISYSFATVLHLLPRLVVLSERYRRQRRRCASGQNTLDIGSVILLMHSGFLSYKGWSYRKQVKYSCTLLCYNRRHQRNAIPRAKDSCVVSGFTL